MGKPGPAVYTDVTLENSTDDSFILYDLHNWYGSANYPQVVPAQLSEKVKHQADPQTGCSKGGVAYTIKNNIRWVVAWSNMKDKENKVYIDIIESNVAIDWEFYRTLLDTSYPNPDAVNKYRHTTVATIDPSSVTPPMKAAVDPAIFV
ncbi:hypothetical protein V6N11_070270 [Hibiscus sabdariffa]|uniref:Uncharacterized protein n=1 Tax=Hibiscus sabdariffa TaxID=183260 RepID=A0ABR2QF02_9ROSI